MSVSRGTCFKLIGITVMMVLAAHITYEFQKLAAEKPPEHWQVNYDGHVWIAHEIRDDGSHYHITTCKGREILVPVVGTHILKLQEAPSEIKVPEVPAVTDSVQDPQAAQEALRSPDSRPVKVKDLRIGPLNSEDIARLKEEM